MDSVFAYLVTAILGGGLFKGIESLYRAVSDSREKKMLSDSIGAKTPAEIESVSVATMRTALESASTRIAVLEAERSTDREYYQQRISQLEEERTVDREFYQTRIKELTDQLQHIREEMEKMEIKLGELRNEDDAQGEGVT